MRFTTSESFRAWIAEQGLSVGGGLYLSGCTGLTALPEKFQEHVVR